MTDPSNKASAGALSRVAIFGALSDIAVAIARRLAEKKASLVLIARDEVALQALAADLEVRGGRIAIVTADFSDLPAASELAEKAWSAFAGLDAALIAFGTLPDQAKMQASASDAAAALALNFTAPVLIADALAARFEAQGSGVIAAISSVAGDRGRQSNYIYGAAKGGLQRALEGMRHRLYPRGVAVLDVRPGFVSTKMTQHLARGPLWAQPDAVAEDIIDAMIARKAVLYTPWFWSLIMLIVRNVPRPIFHRSKL